MNPTVTIHSDADGVTRTITLTKTGADTGRFTMASTAAPGNDQNSDVENVQADPVPLKLACQTQVGFITADIDLSIERGAGGKPRSRPSSSSIRCLATVPTFTHCARAKINWCRNLWSRRRFRRRARPYS